MKYFVRLSICLLLSATTFSQDSGKIFVVRHAEKQSDEADTPLSKLGLARAACLAQTLKNAHITSVFTTQYVRTQQTAAPIVRETDAKDTVIDARSSDRLVNVAKIAAQSGDVLIVGHGDTVPHVLSSLGAPTVTVPDDTYDLLFIFDIRDPQHLTTLHYCPSLPADTTPHTSNSMAKP
jgi:2,3-bisphosphoglycerate-dependent phosphoglycerate mutase